MLLVTLSADAASSADSSAADNATFPADAATTLVLPVTAAVANHCCCL